MEASVIFKFYFFFYFIYLLWLIVCKSRPGPGCRTQQRSHTAFMAGNDTF